jgi:hypothetical protein
VWICKSQLGDIQLNIDIIRYLLALLKEISYLFTNLPKILLDTLGSVSLIDFTIFRQIFNSVLSLLFLDEFNWIWVAFIKINGLGNQVTHLIGLQSIIILQDLCLGFLSSECVTNETKLKV